MNTAEQVSILRILPTRFRRAVYCAGGEAAWPRREACEVIDCLTDMAVAVIGVEIWLPTEPGPTIPTPIVYSWQAEHEGSDVDWLNFIEKANKSAGEYVRTWQWDEADVQHHGLVPYFNLTLEFRSQPEAAAVRE